MFSFFSLNPLSPFSAERSQGTYFIIKARTESAAVCANHCRTAKRKEDVCGRPISLRKGRRLAFRKLATFIGYRSGATLKSFRENQSRRDSNAKKQS